MKALLSLFILLLVSAPAFAQIRLDFRTTGSSFQLGFTRGFVCAVEPSFSEAPTLGYGQSMGMARANAVNNCINETGNHEMHCDDVKCEAINFGADRPTVSVSVVNNRVGVRFSTGAKTSCIAKASFGEGFFVAEAPTRIEAEVYSQRLCMGQTGNARMHCDVEACERMGSTSVITTEDIFGTLEDRIENLKREISALEARIGNPHISARKKRRLMRKLRKKKARLYELEARL